MARRLLASLAALALTACASSSNTPQDSGCTRDTDCREGRICDADLRTCVAATGGSAGSSGTAGTSAAGKAGTSATGGSSAGTGSAGKGDPFGMGGASGSAGSGTAGSGTAGSGTAGSGTAGSGGAACPGAPAGSTCAVFPQCGCKANETCTPDGATKTSCVAAGTKAPADACTSSTECAPGTACVDKVCLPYCAKASDCGASYDDGCVSITNGGSVCAFVCKADAFGACPTPTTSGDACEAPPSPSPYCHEPERNGCPPYKADHCVPVCPTLPGGVACAVSVPSCSCPIGKVCSVAKGQAPACATYGTLKEGAACATAVDCEYGKYCAAGVCRRVCTSSTDCTAPQTCRPVTDNGVPVPFARVCLP